MATSAQGTEPLDTMASVIGSPLEIDNQKRSSIDKSDTHENENFVTPLESHIHSSTSSQEDRQRLRLVAPCDAKGGVSVVAETRADADGRRVENRVSINLGTGDKNLGFSDSGGECRDSVNDAGEIGKFQCQLKRLCTSYGELDKCMSQKIRVLEQHVDSEISDKMNDDKIIDLDTEEIARDRQDFPPHIRGIEEDKRVGESSRYVKVTKASWTDIVNELEVIFEKEDNGYEDVDLLETVKRGITFPRPRWL